MNILVQSSFFSEEFSESSPEGKQFNQAHPECDWRFLSYKECSDEDLAWADVIYGTPDPASLKSAVRLRWLHLMTAGVNNYADPGLFLDPKPIVTRSAGVHAPTMAEHAIGLALAVGRCFPLLYTHQKEHDWHHETARSELFDSTVLLLGTGYLAALSGNVLQVRVGFANEVENVIPEGLTVKCPDAQHVHISGCDKQLVGQFAAEVRAIKKCEPYLGKGIKYEGEVIRRKESKAAGKK